MLFVDNLLSGITPFLFGKDFLSEIGWPLGRFFAGLSIVTLSPYQFKNLRSCFHFRDIVRVNVYMFHCWNSIEDQ